MLDSFPSHIIGLISDLHSFPDTESTLLGYTQYLPCDPYLHNLYISLSYCPSTGQFSEIPSTQTVVSLLYSEYSSPVSPSSPLSSENSSDKARFNKGLKFLSLRIKAILVGRTMKSYKEVAQELIKDLNVGNKAEEKNILRRVYDALNVLMAAGVVDKKEEGYGWVWGDREKEKEKDKDKDRDRERDCGVYKKRKVFEMAAEELFATEALICRNLGMGKRSDGVIRLPVMFSAMSEDGRVVIEADKKSSVIRIKSREEFKIFTDAQVARQCIGTFLKGFNN